MISADDVIVSLTAAAAEAQAREEAFRADMAVTAKRLETERATAYRRLNFMRTLAHLAASAETPEAAAGAAKAHVRASFGWDTCDAQNLVSSEGEGRITPNFAG